MQGYFAKNETREERKAKLARIASKNKTEVRIVKGPPKKAFAEDGDSEEEEKHSSSDGEAKEVQKVEEAEEKKDGEEEEEKKEVEEAKDGDEAEESKEEGETKGAKTPIEEKKQSVFDEDIGGIEINIIGEDGQVKKGKTFEHNRHKPKGTRRPGIRTDRKVYEDD